jgi:hypothetical protein
MIRYHQHTQINNKNILSRLVVLWRHETILPDRVGDKRQPEKVAERLRTQSRLLLRVRRQQRLHADDVSVGLLLSEQHCNHGYDQLDRDELPDLRNRLHGDVSQRHERCQSVFVHVPANLHR